MSSSITLKVDSLTKEKLDNLKKREKFTSFNLGIQTMCSFFELNKISPRDGINQGYQNSISSIEKAVKQGLFEMKKEFSKDSQSMRKLVRAIEKDHMINMSTKISYLYDKHREEKVKKAIENSYDSKVESSKKNLEKDREIEILKDVLEEKNDEIKRLKYKTEEDSNLTKKYESYLIEIYQNTTFKKDLLSGKDKGYIDMPKDDFQNIFDQL